MEIDIARIVASVATILRDVWHIHTSNAALNALGWHIAPGMNASLIAAIFATRDAVTTSLRERFPPETLLTIYNTFLPTPVDRLTPEQQQEVLMSLYRYLVALGN